MKKKLTIAAVFLGLLTVAEAGGSAYFYRRTMKRGNAKKERTIKMAGTDWNQYMPLIQKRKEAMLEQPHEDVFCVSEDGLQLHATYFPYGDRRKIVICFHGYTSQGMSDYVGLSDYYRRQGFSMLLVDERAHGDSEGEYIGFGCLDRIDALMWIDWVLQQCGKETQILLHGTSMGGATVLMSSGLALPEQVKGIISDCGFTSAKEVGYGLGECNAAKEVQKAEVPILLIHGDADTFVPCSMCEKIYENCASDKKMLIVKGAAHAESYYKDMEAYENAMDDFIGGIIK